jgi:hypothetical protein
MQQPRNDQIDSQASSRTEPVLCMCVPMFVLHMTMFVFIYDNVCLHHDNVYLQYDNVRPIHDNVCLQYDNVCLCLVVASSRCGGTVRCGRCCCLGVSAAVLSCTASPPCTIIRPLRLCNPPPPPRPDGWTHGWTDGCAMQRVPMHSRRRRPSSLA